ncbi:MAG TPA: DNA-binding response regulator, partial [Clostridiales bacterium]|nr:DNA-binding response regulator [Clostridiales bacterium]
MRILIIEDDKNILHFLKTGLETEGFVVDVAKDGIKGESLASINEYSLILLDLNLPKKSGDEICNKLRSDNIFTPIIILSVEEDIESKVRLLNSGADDYMLKPFS